MRFFFYSLFFSLALFLIACSSIKKRAVTYFLETAQDKKSSQARYVKPPLSYRRQVHSVLDALWWNSKTQSSLSYFSSCSQTSLDLKSFQQDSYPEDLDYKLLTRIADEGISLYSLLEVSNIEGKSYIAVHTLKKGICYYNINFVAPSYSIFEQEEKVFKEFIKGFQSQ